MVVFLPSVWPFTKLPCADKTAGLTVSCHTLSSVVQSIIGRKSKTVSKLHITNSITTINCLILSRTFDKGNIVLILLQGITAEQ